MLSRGERGQVSFYVLIGLIFLMVIAVFLLFTAVFEKEQRPEEELKEMLLEPDSHLLRSRLENCLSSTNDDPLDALFPNDIVQEHVTIPSEEAALEQIGLVLSRDMEACFGDKGTTVSSRVISVGDVLLFDITVSILRDNQRIEVNLNDRKELPLGALLESITLVREGLERGILITEGLPLSLQLSFFDRYALLQSDQYAFSLQVEVPI